MTRPTAYLLRMLAFLAVVILVSLLLLPKLRVFFANNPPLNSLIFLVEILGIAWNLRQVLRLSPEVNWVEAFQRSRPSLATIPPPRLLAPMARMMASRAEKSRDPQARFTLSAQAMRGLLDSIASRLDESRELSRYMTGLMIFLGLLGTFWGLLRTVASVSDVINGMTMGTGDVNAMFEQLKTGLTGPLSGMATAFSSSMFGLAGALVLGFLDLTAGQAQNRFFNELEEWLAGLTRLSSGVLGSEGEGSVPIYVQALLEQTAENMEGLQTILGRGEESRGHANQTLLQLAEKLSSFSDTMRANQQLMLRIAETQSVLGPALQRLGEHSVPRSDEVAHAHLRNIEVALQRLLAESEQGRVQSTAELRNDLRILTRTIAALAENEAR
ncbi:MAG TPA: flagellar motor protein MotA [Acetobacteraceae bacterium]|nr:flagellar motor protein MotA [Acetobacteraceae bacterium]